MKTEKFKPTYQDEMDVMKSLLDDLSKLRVFVDVFGEANDFWIQQMNVDLYKKLKTAFESFEIKGEDSICQFYSELLKEFEAEFPRYKLDPYHEPYDPGFEFYLTLKNYRIHLQKKIMLKRIENLSIMVDHMEDLHTHVIFDQLEKIRKLYQELVL